jgi:ATP-dependent Lon protease
MVNLPKFFKQDEALPTRETLPLLPLRDIVVFPYMVAPLFVGRDKSVKALTDAMNRDKRVFLATQRKASVDKPQERDINSIGTVGTVLQLLRLPDGTVKALVEGKQRAKIKQFIPGEDFFRVEIALIEAEEESGAEIEALCRATVEGFENFAKLDNSISKDLIRNISAITEPSRLTDTVAAHLSFKILDKQRLLETTSISKRLSLLVELIKMETEIYQVDQRIKPGSRCRWRKPRRTIT